MTEVEERNRELAMRWQDAWNDDAMRMVDECYAEDCEVWDMVRGQCLRGREELRVVEQRILAVDSSRRMKVTKLVASGDTVAVEMEATWRDGTITINACVVLTFDDDGLVVSDHTYSPDPLGVTA